MNLGAGRVVYQELTRIDHEIETGQFAALPVWQAPLRYLKENPDRALHVFGLLSPGGVHSHEKHILALLDCIAPSAVKNVHVHAFLDGRDTPPQSALASLNALNAHMQTLQCGQISSITGRYYAMDRDKRWDRTQRAYELLTQGNAAYHYNDAMQALEAAYARGETDEFVQPSAICADSQTMRFVETGDIVVFMNFRADRARQLTQALTLEHFVGFQRNVRPILQAFLTLTQYAADLPTQVIYFPQSYPNTLGKWISDLGYKQLRIAETEKYAHVTFFFNGGQEQPFPGEARSLIPSPKVATYDLRPEMSAPELTDQLIAAILSGQYQLIVCNYANADMVGHTGNLAATIQAIETIDTCIGRVIAALHQVGGEALITADHGNAEKMFDAQTGQPHTAHTSDAIPLLYYGRKARCVSSAGTLADVAPSLLYLMGIKTPTEMTGRVLFELAE